MDSMHIIGRDTKVQWVSEAYLTQFYRSLYGKKVLYRPTRRNVL